MTNKTKVFDPCPMHPAHSYHECPHSHAWIPKNNSPEKCQCEGRAA